MRLVLLALALFALPASAQDGTIYPDLDGDALALALAGSYTPTATYSYDRARDTLFLAVHMEPADSLRGFYSGHAIWINPALDPTSAAWASSPRFSTEHIWPENRGATEGTPAHKNMHHLAPVMQSINSSRSDHPFGEVIDADADRWWGPEGVTLTAMPPLATRDLYTEKLNGSAALLEPREFVAGDIARAMFYIWTVYGPSGADQVDTDFWAEQLQTLLDWHAQDPPDLAELNRTLAIEEHQGNANPFVLDATLALRAFGEPEPAVALTAFTATATDAGGALVAWSTSAETGVASYRVEGRADTFGTQFELWFAVPAAGVPFDYAAESQPLNAGPYRLHLVAVLLAGGEIDLGEIGVEIPEPVANEQTLSGVLALSPAAPNPARQVARFALTLDQPAHVRAVVHDVVGRQVAVVYDAEATGQVALTVDAAALAPGVYVLHVAVSGDRAAAGVQVQRFTVTR